MQPENPINDDPFREAREKEGVMRCPFEGEMITMLLRHKDVRDAAADWKQFSSDAPFRVPIPSEESMRSVRQLPIEVDPPDHKEYRKLTEPFFLRAKKPEVISAVKSMIESVVDALAEQDSFDAVAEFALPIQSRAFTYLLNMPESEAEVWIRWGVHVFQPQEGESKRGGSLESYLNEQFDRAAADSGEDFFSVLTRIEFRGRKLTRDECLGFANLAFAGGRDTIIHSVTSIIAWLASNPVGLEYLREDPKRIVLASEEFFRVFMPLTQIGRVCPQGADVHGVKVAAGERIGLCWASANHDESVFENAQDVILDRRPNPHVSFGFRDHLCQGAAHARLVVRTMLEVLCSKNLSIEMIDSVRHVEVAKEFTRAVGYDTLNVRFRVNN
ncbi:cytochrome P450 family protein [Mariniblastus fucicola]|uniref:Biotin biosynthesis cytochrome P450 n=1 Tax=Mariniblastus fucicola TaxID=980251 RepID=A0A5B9PCG0_9BACT|nr:cytochrome P450 [Mariniblastus fucicola]QEG23998.1 Biotin biosynthesis cytochrome P450 [Mariniblastus fucicola]